MNKFQEFTILANSNIQKFYEEFWVNEQNTIFENIKIRMMRGDTECSFPAIKFYNDNSLMNFISEKLKEHGFNSKVITIMGGYNTIDTDWLNVDLVNEYK